MGPDLYSSDEEDLYYLGLSRAQILTNRDIPSPTPNPIKFSSQKLKDEFDAAMEMDYKIKLFHRAAEENNLEFMETLLLADVPVDCLGDAGWTALMKACLDGKIEVAQFLLEHGSNPNSHSELFTSLMACCIKNFSTEERKLECVNVLLDHNADVNMKDKYKETALMYASESGFLSIVERLLSVEDIDIQVRDFDGWNALFHAVYYSHTEVVDKLIEAGCDFKKPDSAGRTASLLAEERNYRRLAKKLKDLEGVEEPPYRLRHFFNSLYDYLDELPLPNGEGGFQSDTKVALYEFGFEVDNISFPEFLNMTEKDLYTSGLKLEYERRVILKSAIHRYHLCPWKKASNSEIVHGAPMRIENGVQILGNTAKHLTLLKASVKYLLGRISSRLTLGDATAEGELIECLVSIYNTNEIINQKLCKILELSDKVKLFVPEDLIVRPKKRRISFKHVAALLGATAAGLIFYSKACI